MRELEEALMKLEGEKKLTAKEWKRLEEKFKKIRKNGSTSPPNQNAKSPSPSHLEEDEESNNNNYFKELPYLDFRSNKHPSSWEEDKRNTRFEHKQKKKADKKLRPAGRKAESSSSRLGEDNSNDQQLFLEEMPRLGLSVDETVTSWQEDKRNRNFEKSQMKRADKHSRRASRNAEWPPPRPREDSNEEYYSLEDFLDTEESNPLQFEEDESNECYHSLEEMPCRAGCSSPQQIEEKSNQYYFSLEEMPCLDVWVDDSFTSHEESKMSKRFEYKQKKKAERILRRSRQETAPGGYMDYMRTRSQCDISGAMYEVKVSALLYVRAVSRQLDFLLATSVEAADVFDDVRFARATGSGPRQALVQLKHKERRSITRASLLAEDTPKQSFSLLKYYKCFANLRASYPENKVLNSYSRFEDIAFVLYTNAPAESSDAIFANADLCSGDQDLLRMRGKVFSFARNRQFTDEFKRAHAGVVDAEVADEFFGQFYMYTNQIREKELCEEIEREIKSSYGTSDYGANKVLESLVAWILSWWRDRTTTRKPLKNGDFHVRSGSEVLAELSAGEPELQFGSAATAKIKDVLATDAKIVNCVTSTDACGPARDVLLQSVREAATQCVTVSLEDFESSREDILYCWPSERCPILVITHESTMQIPLKTLKKMSVLIEELLVRNKESKLFLVSKQGRLVQTLFPGYSESSYDEVDVTCEMKHLTEQCKERILKKIINFQGSDVPVQSIVGDHCENAVDAELLSLLAYSDKILRMGGMNEEKLEFYKDRMLTRNCYLKKNILNSNSRGVFAVSGVAGKHLDAFADLSGRSSESCSVAESTRSISEEMSSVYNNMAQLYSYCRGTAASLLLAFLFRQAVEKNCSNKPNIGASSKKCFHLIHSLDDFSKLCKENKNANVHWLHVQGEKLKWMKSRGNVNIITRHLSEEKDFFKVDDVWDIPDRIVVLTGDSGMGKTSLLRQIAINSKNKQPEMCVIQISLIECLTDLENLPYKITLDQACEFLIRNGILLSETAEGSAIALFKHVLTRTYKAVVLVDGIDEVYLENKRKILNLIRRFCRLRVSKLWITSRRTMASKLERLTDSIAFELQPLNEPESEQLIKHFLRKDEQCPFCDLKTTSIYQDLQFLGNPLHCSMMAEIVNNCEHTKNVFLGNENGIDTLTFMEAIVETKFKIYCKKYINFTSQNKQTDEVIDMKRKLFIKNHQLSALSQIPTLPLKYKQEIRKELSKFIKAVKHDADKTGIIYSFHGGTAQFEHKIYAEYFLALWMAENCGYAHLPVKKKVFQCIVFNPQLSYAVDFFNMMTARQLAHPFAVTKQQLELHFLLKR